MFMRVHKRNLAEKLLFEQKRTLNVRAKKIRKTRSLNFRAKNEKLGKLEV